MLAFPRAVVGAARAACAPPLARSLCGAAYGAGPPSPRAAWVWRVYLSLDRVPCGWHVMVKMPDENIIRTSVSINACQFRASSSILWKHPLTAGPSFLMGVLGAAPAALASRSVSQDFPSYTAWGRQRLPLLRAALQAAACYMTVRNTATTEDEEMLSRSGIAELSCAFFPATQSA